MGDAYCPRSVSSGVINACLQFERTHLLATIEQGWDGFGKGYFWPLRDTYSRLEQWLSPSSSASDCKAKTVSAGGSASSCATRRVRGRSRLL